MQPATPNSRARFALTVATLFLFILPAPAWPLDTPEARSTLKGIKALRVEVESLPSDLERLGLTNDQIRTDVELRLRQLGITVSDPEDPATPLLWVALNSHHQTDSPVVGFSIKVEFIQFVRLSRNRNIRAPAPTWTVDGVGTADVSPSEATRTEIRGLLRDFVDRFLNAYLEQNPKQ